MSEVTELVVNDKPFSEENNFSAITQLVSLPHLHCMYQNHNKYSIGIVLLGQ